MGELYKTEGENMRAFLAVNLNTELQKELARIQNMLRSKIHGVRWVDPQLLHITLKFLGDLDRDLLPVLEKPLRELGERTAFFTVSLAHLGAFPSLGKPRVFWIGVKEGARQLSSLAANIEQSLKAVKHFSQGGTRENTGKSFRPHITLGRRKYRGKQGEMGKGLFEKIEACRNVLRVKSFYLMQSTLYPTGPVYEPLLEFLLNPQK